MVTFVLVQPLRKVPGNAHLNGGSGSRHGLLLPTDIPSHSRSYAAVLEVSYGVSWVTTGDWRPIWHA